MRANCGRFQLFLHWKVKFKHDNKIGLNKTLNGNKSDSLPDHFILLFYTLQRYTSVHVRTDPISLSLFPTLRDLLLSNWHGSLIPHYNTEFLPQSRAPEL